MTGRMEEVRKARLDDMPTREKVWDERGLEERVELLRQELRSQMMHMEHLLRDVSMFKQILEAHQHSADGTLLVRTYGVNWPGVSPAQDLSGGALRWRDRLE